jgi:hypothetical protein
MATLVCWPTCFGQIILSETNVHKHVPDTKNKESQFFNDDFSTTQKPYSEAINGIKEWLEDSLPNFILEKQHAFDRIKIHEKAAGIQGAAKKR